MEPSSSTQQQSSSDLRFDAYAAVVAIGVAAVLAVLFWRLYRLTVSARPEDMAPAAAAAGKAAVRKRDMAALPVFVHAATADGDGAASAALECAVCLAEVRDGERGRLLPRCGHRFHVECIDRWFMANSTCPICRAAAVGQPDAVAACKVGPAPVVVVVQTGPEPAFSYFAGSNVFL
ncbi:unnamed protein product [Urochloa humidicola]